MPEVGEIYYYPNYEFPDGAKRHKFVILMGQTSFDDWVIGRTTSKSNLRVRAPLCSLAPPYPGFYMAKAGNIFPLDSWLALDRLDDHDIAQFNSLIAKNVISFHARLPNTVLLDLLDCARRSEDVTKAQDRAIADAIDVVNRS